MRRIPLLVFLAVLALLAARHAVTPHPTPAVHSSAATVPSPVTPLVLPASGPRPGNAVSPAARQHLVSSYGKLPLSFEANQGQTDRQVRFLSRGNGYSLFLTGTEAVLSLKDSPPSTQRTSSNLH